MMEATKRTFAAASTARYAALTAVAAKNLLYRDPEAWDFADQAYWLCRTAEKKALEAADCLDPEWAETESAVILAYTEANEAARNACEMADTLVSLALAANHEIRRNPAD
jgi:hypothetical protein